MHTNKYATSVYWMAFIIGKTKTIFHHSLPIGNFHISLERQSNPKVIKTRQRHCAPCERNPLDNVIQRFFGAPIPTTSMFVVRHGRHGCRRAELERCQIRSLQHAVVRLMNCTNAAPRCEWAQNFQSRQQVTCHLESRRQVRAHCVQSHARTDVTKCAPSTSETDVFARKR